MEKEEYPNMLPEIECVAPNLYKEESCGVVGNGITYMPIKEHITECKNRPIEYLVIHYTAGGSSKSGKAKQERDGFLVSKASADFVIDDENIIQVNPDIRNNFCWAVGDGKGKYGITNKNSIHIEICSNLEKGASFKYPNHDGWYFTDACLEKAVFLAKMLLCIYRIPYDKLIRHFDATDKLCPGIIGWNTGTIYDRVTGKPIGKKNDDYAWHKFKEMVMNFGENKEENDE